MTVREVKQKARRRGVYVEDTTVCANGRKLFQVGSRELAAELHYTLRRLKQEGYRLVKD